MHRFGGLRLREIADRLGISVTLAHALVAEAEEELKRPDAASLTFTVVQAWGRV